MNASIPILSAVIGVVVLLFGRKLFWLCVAAIGFAAGVTLASHIVSEPSALLQLTFAILLGFIGALLAQYASHYWLTFIIGGLIGAILLLMLFDWALIFISSLIGAHLITSAISLPPTGEVLLFTALVLLGFFIQAVSMRRKGAVAA